MTITVTPAPERTERKICKELASETGRSELIMKGHSAFIGSIGTMPYLDVYLVTFSAVVLLKNPIDTWGSADFIVHEWIDLNINWKEKGY